MRFVRDKLLIIEADRRVALEAAEVRDRVAISNSFICRLQITAGRLLRQDRALSVRKANASVGSDDNCDGGEVSGCPISNLSSAAGGGLPDVEAVRREKLKAARDHCEELRQTRLKNLVSLSKQVQVERSQSVERNQLLERSNRAAREQSVKDVIERLAPALQSSIAAFFAATVTNDAERVGVATLDDDGGDEDAGTSAASSSKAIDRERRDASPRVRARVVALQHACTPEPAQQASTKLSFARRARSVSPPPTSAVQLPSALNIMSLLAQRCEGKSAKAATAASMDWIRDMAKGDSCTALRLLNRSIVELKREEAIVLRRRRDAEQRIHFAVQEQTLLRLALAKVEDTAEQRRAGILRSVVAQSKTASKLSDAQVRLAQLPECVQRELKRTDDAAGNDARANQCGSAGGGTALQKKRQKKPKGSNASCTTLVFSASELDKVLAESLERSMKQLHMQRRAEMSACVEALSARLANAEADWRRTRVDVRDVVLGALRDGKTHAGDDGVGGAGRRQAEVKRSNECGSYETPLLLLDDRQRPPPSMASKGTRARNMEACSTVLPALRKNPDANRQILLLELKHHLHTAAKSSSSQHQHSSLREGCSIPTTTTHQPMHAVDSPNLFWLTSLIKLVQHADALGGGSGAADGFVFCVCRPQQDSAATVDGDRQESDQHPLNDQHTSTMAPFVERITLVDVRLLHRVCSVVRVSGIVVDSPGFAFDRLASAAMIEVALFHPEWTRLEIRTASSSSTDAPPPLFTPENVLTVVQSILRKQRELALHRRGLRIAAEKEKQMLQEEASDAKRLSVFRRIASTAATMTVEYSFRVERLERQWLVALEGEARLLLCAMVTEDASKLHTIVSRRASCETAQRALLAEEQVERQTIENLSERNAALLAKEVSLVKQTFRRLSRRATAFGLTSMRRLQSSVTGSSKPQGPTAQMSGGGKAAGTAVARGENSEDLNPPAVRRSAAAIVVVSPREMDSGSDPQTPTAEESHQQQLHQLQHSNEPLDAITSRSYGDMATSMALTGTATVSLDDDSFRTTSAAPHHDGDLIGTPQQESQQATEPQLHRVTAAVAPSELMEADVTRQIYSSSAANRPRSKGQLSFQSPPPSRQRVEE